MRKLSIGAALVAVAIAVPLSIGSSHREAPNIALDPTADNTDTYAFTAKDAQDSLTVVANWIPGEVPANGPNESALPSTVYEPLKRLQPSVPAARLSVMKFNVACVPSTGESPFRVASSHCVPTRGFAG